MGTFNFSAKYLSKKDSSTMLPELTEFVPATRKGIAKKILNMQISKSPIISIARNDRWFAYLHIQNGASKIIWILTYSWTGNFLLAWAGQIAGIENQTMHRFEQYLKILQLYHENSRFPPSFKFWSVSTIQKHWEEVKKMHPARLSRP